MKVICVGYPKTGTKSMREALDILGYKNVHDFFEQVAFDDEIIQKALFNNCATIDDFKKAYCDVDGTTDMPAVYMWKDILKAFPESKVILMVRDSPEEWIKSYSHMRKKEYNYVKYLKYFGFLIEKRLCPVNARCIKYMEESTRRIAGTQAQVRLDAKLSEIAKENYLKHNKDVLENCPKAQLLVFNLKEGWKPLCEFLNKPVPEVKFPRRNVNHTVTKECYYGTVKFDGGTSKAVVRERRRLTAIIICVIMLVLSIILNYFM